MVADSVNRIFGRLEGSDFVTPVRQRPHVRCQIDSIDFATPIIRKNASSALVRFLRSLLGDDSSTRASRLEILKLFSSNHEEAATARDRLLILRDPVERVRSVYQNKFVDLVGDGKQPGDIGLEAERITGRSARDFDWESFVFEYVLSGKAVDPHFKPQVAHLGSISYNRVVLLEALPIAMANIIGPELAQVFFARKFNESHGAEELASQQATGALREFYAADYELLDAVEWGESE